MAESSDKLRPSHRDVLNNPRKPNLFSILKSYKMKERWLDQAWKEIALMVYKTAYQTALVSKLLNFIKDLKIRKKSRLKNVKVTSS